MDYRSNHMLVFACRTQTVRNWQSFFLPVALNRSKLGNDANDDQALKLRVPTPYICVRMDSTGAYSRCILAFLSSQKVRMLASDVSNLFDGLQFCLVLGHSLQLVVVLT